MNTKIFSAKELLRGSGISVLDAARFVRNILDAKVGGAHGSAANVQFVLKVIECGLRGVRNTEMGFEKGFRAYVEAKAHLRKESLRDIRWVGERLMRFRPELKGRNFSEFTVAECEEWLEKAFSTPSQFNKARTMLHGLFEFALRRGWADCNPTKRIERKKVVEREIEPLKLEQVRRLIETARREGDGGCYAAAAMLAYAGIRPREVRRLQWRDVDLEEGAITVRSVCSKTGGVRQVEILPVLRRILSGGRGVGAICPRGWDRRWRRIRDTSGFRGHWVQDVLRHTYASYHAKRYGNLARLQLCMGHGSLLLLRSRYVNMRGISLASSAGFFN